MSQQKRVSYYSNSDGWSDFFPTTLSQQGLSESFLEDLIVGRPEILHLTSRKSGISGPYVIIQQPTFYPEVGI